MKDPLFLAEAARSGMDISPVGGEEAQKVAESIANTERVRAGPRQGDPGELIR